MVSVCDVTRDSLIQLARSLDIEVVESPISRDQLYIAEEVFVCGTAAEVIGLREIDYRTIHDGKTGPVTREIQKMYHDVIRGKIEKYADWCEYVTDVKVKINREMLQENVFGYGELQGRMIFAEVVIDYQGEVVHARLEYDAEKDYPLMRLL